MPILHRTITLLTMLLSASRLTAQASDSLPGLVSASDTVRLHERSTVLVHGILVRRDSTGLVVVDMRTRDTVHIPIFQITRAEVQRGSHRQGPEVAERGLKVGVAIGTILVVIAIVAPSEHDDGVGVVVAGLAAVVSAGAGAFFGLLASLTSTETWYPFDPSAVPLP